jgi:hypothetical protein
MPRRKGVLERNEIMKVKNLPVVVVPYDVPNLDQIVVRQALDMLGKQRKCLYVLPSVLDCIKAEKTIRSFEQFFVQELHVIRAYDDLSSDYFLIETPPNSFADISHVIVATTEYCVTGCMLDKFKGWEIIFHGGPKVCREESVFTTSLSKTWLSEMFQLEGFSEGRFKINVKKRVRRLSLVTDNLARVVSRLHTFSKLGNAGCFLSWKKAGKFIWYSKWSIRELKAFKSITIYVEQRPVELTMLAKIMGTA